MLSIQTNDKYLRWITWLDHYSLYVHIKTSLYSRNMEFDIFMCLNMKLMFNFLKYKKTKIRIYYITSVWFSNYLNYNFSISFLLKLTYLVTVLFVIIGKFIFIIDIGQEIDVSFTLFIKNILINGVNPNFFFL
jgi:hypothetical protein